MGGVPHNMWKTRVGKLRSPGLQWAQPHTRGPQRKHRLGGADAGVTFLFTPLGLEALEDMLAQKVTHVNHNLA